MKTLKAGKIAVLRDDIEITGLEGVRKAMVDGKVRDVVMLERQMHAVLGEQGWVKVWPDVEMYRLIDRQLCPGVLIDKDATEKAKDGVVYVTLAEGEKEPDESLKPIVFVVDGSIDGGYAYLRGLGYKVDLKERVTDTEVADENEKLEQIDQIKKRIVEMTGLLRLKETETKKIEELAKGIESVNTLYWDCTGETLETNVDYDKLLVRKRSLLAEQERLRKDIANSKKLLSSQEDSEQSSREYSKEDAALMKLITDLELCGVLSVKI